MSEIERFFTGAVITATSAVATTSPRFPFGRYAGGGVIIANTNSATQINWHVAVGPETTPFRVYADGSGVSTAVTDGAHPIPDACFGFGYVVPVIVGATTCAMTVSVKG
jgi:hypothetical protein